METILFNARHRADEMMLDDRIKKQFEPEMAVYRYLRSLQTATVNSAFNRRAKKDYTIQIEWMNACSNFDIADNSCEIGGDKLSTNIEEYTLDHRFVKGFSVDDEDFRDNEFNATEAIAKGLVKIDKELSEDFSRYLVGMLNTFAGVNQVPGVPPGIVVNGDITEIQSALWTPNIMAYFARTMIMNRFTSAALIHGSNLFETLYTAAANAANANDKGDYILWNKMQHWFDLFNVDTVNGGDFFSYMVSSGAIAMANKAWNPDAPERTFHDIRYTMPSRFMEGMRYDVFYTNSCDEHATGNNSDILKHDWKVVLTADVFLNPEGCQEDNTGILRFQNV